MAILTKLDDLQKENERLKKQISRFNYINKEHVDAMLLDIEFQREEELYNKINHSCDTDQGKKLYNK